MNAVVDHYIDQHLSMESSFCGAELPWLQRQRLHGINYFRENGFPNQRMEDWRYTSVQTIARKLFQVDAAPTGLELDLSGHQIGGLDSHQLVFVNGRFAPHLSHEIGDIEGVSLMSWEQALSSHSDQVEQLASSNSELRHGFEALNVAFSADGYIVHVSDSVKLDKPVEMLFVSVGKQTTALPRNTIVLGKFAKANVLERHVSFDDEDTLVNASNKISLGEGANLHYHLLQGSSNKTKQVSTIDVDQAKDSNFLSCTMTLGGGLVRNNLTVSLNGPGAHCDMLGLYVTTAKQHVDNHTNVVHAAPHCTSRELYKGVLDQRSRGVFHGRIKVEQDAQKTDATQANNNLLLSNDAEIDTKPQLEIYADDVKCAHGATVGQIDETSLFYLRTRGIDLEMARTLLTYAFVNEVLECIDNVALRDDISSLISGRLIQDD